MSDDGQQATVSAKAEAEGVGSEAGGSLAALKHADDVLLAKLGYRSEFRREFSVSCSSFLLSFSYPSLLYDV